MKGKKMNKKSKEIVEKIMKSPTSYVGCFNTYEAANRCRCQAKARFILKVGKELWVMKGSLATHFNNCGYEYVR